VTVAGGVGLEIGSDGSVSDASSSDPHHTTMRVDATVARRRAKEMKKRRKMMPPTYIRTTKATDSQQQIVNAYGIATYREVNPGLITLVTFPFLFGIMFGDFGHGLMLTFIGLAVVLLEKKLEKGSGDLYDYIYNGRYMILSMGAVAAFCGFMYNECFSLSMNFFGSSWECDEHTQECVKKYTYWLGFDPIWRQSTNNLIFANSVKMKMSVIVGVLHMVFGIFFSGMNAVYFKNKVNFWCEFVPQMTMMLAMFGYMCFMIIYKWMFVSDRENAPMLIRTMINMFLSFNDPIKPEELLYPGQFNIQRILVVVIIACVPWLLIPKPTILILRHRAQVKAEKEKQGKGGESGKGKGTKDGYVPIDGSHQTTSIVSSSSSSSTSSSSAPGVAMHEEREEDDEEEEFNIGEILVHQMIETIEFSLSCISNTASYLRLWALSLAHGQLSEVFFDYGMIKAGELAGFMGLTLGVVVWIGATICILLLMEGLSAFLHGLRLHWVELQNKFYKAIGRPFEPLDFPSLIRKEERWCMDFEATEKEKLEKEV